jgi:hypothetical protein
MPRDVDIGFQNEPADALEEAMTNNLILVMSYCTVQYQDNAIMFA